MDEIIDNLLAELPAALALAFLATIKAMRGRVNSVQLVRALENRDVDAAIDALNIDAGSFNVYTLEKQAQFVKAGDAVAQGLTQERKVVVARSIAKAAPEPALRSPIMTPPVADAGGSGARLPPVDQPPAPTASPAMPVEPPRIPGAAVPGGGQIVFSFDMHNPRAEAKIRQDAATRVQGYVDEQIATARKVIGDGYQRGAGPQQIAVEIAGRINPVSGKREGGIIGLSDPQAGYVDNMRKRLKSGDPAQMVKVLGQFDKDGKWVPGTGMTLRDKRYDAQIKKAIAAVAAGKPSTLTDDKIEEMTSKYSDRLIKKRADDVARTETASGVEMARMEASKQALTKAKLPSDALVKTWVHQGGVLHARDWHLDMNGESVTGSDTPFNLPDGSVMQHAHDPAGGAANNVSCRCATDMTIDWAWGL